ncbi:MAG: hypothetical protein J5J00_17180 [Deltaproteobacteria bacterium]|nr:hypothetical protein [Deltaproteobacteria bacterium]
MQSFDAREYLPKAQQSVLKSPAAGNPELLRSSLRATAEELDYLLSITGGAPLPELTGQRPAGRSLYLSGPFGSFKAKGLAGYLPEIGIVDREPQNLYRRLNEPHLKITSDWRAEIVYSPPSARFSMPAERACREFDCLERLARCGVAREPLLVATLYDKGGGPEHDFAGRLTGAVYSRGGEADIFLGELLSFGVVGCDVINSGVMVVRNNPAPRTFEERELLNIVAESCEFMAAIGMLRRRAIDSGVFRHVSHLGNFLVDKYNGTLSLADTDSCLILERDLPQELVGQQLVRDLASDLTRQIAGLSYKLFSGRYLRMLDHQGPFRFNTFYNFLRGYFADDLSDSEVRSASRALTAKYAAFVKDPDVFQDLALLAQQKANSVLCGTSRVQHKLHLQWDFIHASFKGTAMGAVYDLLRKSKAHKELFPDPQTGAEVEERLRPGLKTYISEYRAAIRRAWGI